MTNPTLPLAGVFAILAVLVATLPRMEGHRVKLGQPGQSCVGEEEPVELVIESRGIVRLQGQVVALPELPAAVRKWMRPRAQRAVFVFAASEVDYGAVAGAIGALAREAEHIVLLTPRLAAAGRGCYRIGPGWHREAAPVPPSHMQPVPRWKLW